MNQKNDKENNQDVFQELYELILEEAEGKKPTRKRSTQDKFDHTPDAIDFLENENLRLNKLNSFFGIKLENLKSNHQTQALIQRQEKELFTAKAELIAKMDKEGSHLQKQMAFLWDKTFA